MTKFRVYVAETVEYCYTVEAENSIDAENKIMNSDYDDDGDEVVDSYESQITDIEEIK